MSGAYRSVAKKFSYQVLLMHVLVCFSLSLTGISLYLAMIVLHLH